MNVLAVLLTWQSIVKIFTKDYRVKPDNDMFDESLLLLKT